MEVMAEQSHSFSPHVLLAEDDDLTLRIVEQLLKQCNYKVTVARNGQEALDTLQHNDTERFDLILTDIMMPKVNGMDLVYEVNHRKELSHLPVIVMSSEQSQEAICKAYTVGAADYLIKPIRRNTVATLWHHIWRRVMAAGAGTQQGDAAEWICANYRHNLLSAATLNATCLRQCDHPNAASCEGQSTTLPPKKRPRLSRDCASSQAQGQAAPGAHPPQNGAAASVKCVESEGSDSGASEGGHLRSSSAQEEWTGEAMQVSFVRPHEAPVFSSTDGMACGARSSLPRILSAPSILAFERLHCAQHVAPTAMSGHKRLRTEDSDSGARQLSCAVSDDSGASESTRDAAALADGAGSAAAFPLKGCESLGVSSRMVVSVDLEIAPLNLSPWPSTGSPLSVEGPTCSAADLSKKQADEAAAALCVLARSFTAVVPRPCARGNVDASTPLPMDWQRVAAHSSTITTAAAAGSNIVMGAPSIVVAHKQQQQHIQIQQHSFCRALKFATDLHAEMVTKGDPATWAANRKAALEKLREKKKLRSFQKKVRYESRRRLAESRPRVRGQFVKASTLAATSVEC